MPVIVYSTNDPAGTNIAEHIKTTSSLKVVPVSSDLLHCEKEVSKLSADLVIFASKHKSEKAFPSLTVHVPGNWGSAEMGGKPNEINASDPIVMKSILTNMKELAKKKAVQFDVTMECDHHGPVVNVPCMFAELGSSEKEWENKEAAAVAAESIINVVEKDKRAIAEKVIFGIGGGHYCHAFTKIELEGSIAVAHVLPKYQVDNVDYGTFEQGIKKCTKPVDYVCIDWKGLNKGQRDKIIEFCKQAEIEWRRV